MNWIIQGIRPKTLIAGIIPPVLAYSIYYSSGKSEGALYFILCLLLAVFIQISTNFYNDGIDYKKGADEKRVGPHRVTTQMNINYHSVMLVGHIFLLLAFIVGIPLILKGGILIGILGGLSLFLAYGYTGGPFPLAYIGLGELFVILFFGLVATCGSYFLISGGLNLYVISVGFQLGLLSSVLIAINNYRDKETDLEVNKRTLATRMSKDKYLILIDFFLFFPYILLFIQTIFYDLKSFLPIFAIPLAYKIRLGLREIARPEDCNQYLALSAKHLAIFGILFIIKNLWT